MTQNLVGTEVLQVNGIAANSQLSGQTFTTTTANIAALSGANPNAPTAVTTGSVTAKVGGKYYVTAAAGATITLPGATGTGGVIRVIVGTTVTSNSLKILTNPITDNLMGRVVTNVSGTATVWDSLTATGNHSLQINGTTTGGIQGDSYEFLDMATGVWEVVAFTQSSGTAATPFSTSTT